MKKILLFALMLLSLEVYSQAIVKGSGVVYTNGAPTHSVNINADSELAIDTTTGFWYEYQRDVPAWRLAGFRIQKFAFSIPPTATPSDKQSELLLNNVDSLYRWRAGAWHHLNPGAAYTAGIGIDITGLVITNTAPDQVVVLNNGTGISITGTYPNFTIDATGGASGYSEVQEEGSALTARTKLNFVGSTATAVDDGGNSRTNVNFDSDVNALANNSTTGIYVITATGSSTTRTVTAGIGISVSNGSGVSGNPTITNSSPDQTVTITNGGGVVVTGTYPNFTLTATDQSISNEGILGVGAGSGTSSTLISNTSTSNPVTINASTGLSISESTNANGGSITLTNSAPDQTVTITNGGGVVVTGTYPSFTLTATDQSVTNEIQTLSANGIGGNYDINLSLSGGNIGIDQGSKVTINRSGDNFTFSAQEYQYFINTSDGTSHTLTLEDAFDSSSNGSIQLVEGSGITLTTSGDAGNAVVTIASSGGGGSSPAGANYQVQYYDDGDFGAENVFNYDPTNNRLVVGTTTATAVLHGRAPDDAGSRIFLAENQSANDVLAIFSTGITKWGDNETYPIVKQTASAGSSVSYTANGLTFESAPVASTGTDLFSFYHPSTGLTSGNYNIVRQTGTVAPSSGSATYNSFVSDPIINATGGGLITGYKATPTLTSTSGGYQAFTTDINSSTGRWAFYGGGTAASRVGGTLGVGADPVASFQLYSTGAIRADAALVSRGSGTSPASDLAVPQLRLWNTTGDTWYLSSLNSGSFRLETGIGTVLSIDNSAGQVYVQNTLRIGSVTGTPTSIIGRDGTGQVGAITVGSGLDLTAGVLTTSGGGGSGDVLNNGNSFGAAFIVGSNDNNTVSLEQNGTTFLTGGTDKNITLINSVAATNTVTDRFKVQTNSTGTAANNFGSAILFQAENSTTNDINQSRISSYWKSAANGSEVSAIDFQLMQGGGGLATVMSINRSGSATGMLEIGSTTPVQITNAGIYPGASYTFGGTSSSVTLSSTSSGVNLERTNAATTTPLAFDISSISSGTAGVGFGTNIIFKGESSTTNGREMGSISTVWTTATDASRTADMIIGTVISGGTSVERIRIVGATGNVHLNQGLRIAVPSGTPTSLIGRNGSGDVGTLALNKELTIVSGELNTTGLGSTAPTFTLGAGWGTGSSSSIVGTDLVGEITINSGTGAMTATTFGTVNFGSNFDNTSYAVFFREGEANSSQISTYLGYATSKAVGSFVQTGATALASRIQTSTTYKYYYRVIQYQ